MRRTRLPYGWAKIRRRILQRDPVCQDGRACSGLAPSTEVDHVIPGDDHSDANLQGICGDCHRAKSSAEGVAARR